MSDRLRAADLVVENAAVWTDGRSGEAADFIAVRGGRFIHVGPQDDALIGSNTKRIDAAGRRVLPGFIDCHVHLLWGGFYLTHEVDLSEVRSAQEFRQALKAWIDERSTQTLAWIGGGRWNSDTWTPPISPTRELIDDLTGDTPALLIRMDGHSALANSAALRLAGITRSTPNPEGGAIDRDPQTGDATGMLRERAMDLVKKHRSAPSLENKIAACRAASREAFRHGVTTVGDIVEPTNLEAYAELARVEPKDPESDEMVRSYMYVNDPDWKSLIGPAREFPDRPDFVQVAGLKDFLDGSLGSRTAAMIEPYLVAGDEPEPASPRGLYMDRIREGRLRKNIECAKRHDMQPILHAIGDEANHFLLETLEAVYGDSASIRAARPRSEHTQHVLADDIARFASLGVIPSMQPYHKAVDARIVPALLGESRCKGAYTWRSLLEAGATVAFGSDWPIVTINPFPALASAVYGVTATGETWQTDQNIDMRDALRSYTTRAAFALGAERTLGRIAVGYAADLVILDDDPLAAGRDALASIHPALTMKNGRVVYGE